jgi:hypothetical protein
MAYRTRRLRAASVRCYVGRGYRGHAVNGDTAVVVAGRRRGITPTIKRELRRRSAIEAMIGHMKLDGKLARNHLKGALGDTIHALLCGAYSPRSSQTATSPLNRPNGKLATPRCSPLSRIPAQPEPPPRLMSASSTTTECATVR